MEDEASTSEERIGVWYEPMLSEELKQVWKHTHWL